MVGPFAAGTPRSLGGCHMKTAIVGTAQGIFVVDAAGGGSSRGLAGPSVRHLSRVNGHCLAGSTAGIFRSPDGGRDWEGGRVGGPRGWGRDAGPRGRRKPL